MGRQDGTRTGHQKHDRSDRAASYYRIVLVVIGVAGAGLQAAALGPLRNSFWGFHLFGFLPLWTAVLSWIVLAAAAAFLLFSTGWKKAGTKSAGRITRIPIWAVVGVAVVCAVIFWVLRSQQTLLGDGLPLTISLPQGQSFHPRQPLAMWLQQSVFRGFGGVLGDENTIASMLAHRTVALGSVLAGFLFVLTAFGLGRTLDRMVGGGGDRKKTARSDAVPLLVTVVLLTQGYAVLFFGYVENYTYFVLTLALYLLASVLYLQRRVPLAVAAFALVLGIGIHLSAVMMLPSFLFIFAWGAYRRDKRVDALAGLAAGVAGVLLLNWMLGRLSPGYTIWGGFAQIFDVASSTQGGGAGLSYIFSWKHVRDFFNEQYLIGPLAAFLFVAALAYAVSRRDYRNPSSVFMTLAAGVYLAGSWVTSDPLLGYARDWDLFAPPAVCYCAAGLYLVLSHVSSSTHKRRLMAFAAVLSVIFLAPWVSINHSEALTLERFKTLPLGYGRTEVAVGNWYMRNDRPADAEAWFKRALEVNNANVNAYYLLGVLYASNENVELACKLLDVAVKLRPDKPDYRERYVQALFDAGRCQDAVPHLHWLAKRIPNDFFYWQEVGRDMNRLGCVDSLAGIYAPVMAAVERRLEAYPDDLDAHLSAGILLGNLNRYEEAIARSRRALEIDPDSPAGLFNTGMALLQLGRRDEARPLLEKFISLYPDHPMNEFAKQQLAP